MVNDPFLEILIVTANAEIIEYDLPIFFVENRL